MTSVITKVGGRENIAFATAATEFIEMLRPAKVGSSFSIEGGTIANNTASAAIAFLMAGTSLGAIATISIANPTVVTFASDHGLEIGVPVSIYVIGSDSTPLIDGRRVFTPTTADAGEVPVNVTVGGSAGEVVFEDDPMHGLGTGGSGATGGMLFQGVADNPIMVPHLRFPKGKGIVITTSAAAAIIAGHLLVGESTR